MLEKLNEIERTALKSLDAVHDPEALEAWRVANVGRSSPLMQVFAGLGKLSKDERPAVGAEANRVKVALRVNGYYPSERFLAALETASSSAARPAPAQGRRKPGGKPVALLFETGACGACEDLIAR